MRLWLAVFFFGAGFCNAAAEWSEPIACRMHHNRFVLPLQINGKPAHFLLDTACTIETIHPGLMKELGLQPRGSVRINGIAGEERAPTYRGVSFQIKDTRYSPRRVASIPSEESHSRRRHDGVLGSGFFERFVVEFNPGTKSVRLHEPTNFTYKGEGTILPFYFRKEIPVVKGIMEYSKQNKIEGEFEIDSGCDSGLCIGDHFIKKHKLLELNNTTSDEKFGVGGNVQTRNGRLPAFLLANLRATNVQADYFLDASPVDEPLAGHIGIGFLGRYKTIFDYKNKRIILEPLTSRPAKD